MATYNFISVYVQKHNKQIFMFLIVYMSINSFSIDRFVKNIYKYVNECASVFGIRLLFLFSRSHLYHACILLLYYVAVLLCVYCTNEILIKY